MADIFIGLGVGYTALAVAMVIFGLVQLKGWVTDAWNSVKAASQGS